MSVVSGVSLICSCCEYQDKVSVHLRTWLTEQGIAANFVETSGVSGGNKHPQTLQFEGGFNYFPEDVFAAYVGTAPWLNPENVVLVIQPEDGPTRIWCFRNEWCLV